MATQFSIDDAFVLEGDEEGAVSNGEPEGWKSRDKDREGGEMTFGSLSFSKPQSHPSPAATGSLEHSNLKYQVAYIYCVFRCKAVCYGIETDTFFNICWFFRIWRMRTPWETTETPLSITSSKSGGSHQEDF